MLTGSCLCEEVAYEADAEPGTIVPLRDLPQDPWLGVFDRYHRPARTVPLDQG